MKIAIIVDSSTGLTKEQAEKKGWFYLPLYFNLGNKEYRDGIDVDRKSLFDILENDPNMKDLKGATSATPIGEAIQLVESIQDKYDKILIYPISEGLSSQYANLKVTFNNYKKVHVVKSKKVAVLILLDLINFENNIAKGMEYNSAVQILEQPIDGDFLLIPKFNDNLVKGGRLTPSAAAIANLLKICPVIRFDENGKLTKEGKGRIFRKTISKYFQSLLDKRSHKNYSVFVIHSENKEIEDIKENLHEKSGKYINEYYIPNIISIHTGIEAVAFAVLDNISSETIKKINKLFE